MCSGLLLRIAALGLFAALPVDRAALVDDLLSPEPSRFQPAEGKLLRLGPTERDSLIPALREAVREPAKAPRAVLALKLFGAAASSVADELVSEPSEQARKYGEELRSSIQDTLALAERVNAWQSQSEKKARSNASRELRAKITELQVAGRLTGAMLPSLLACLGDPEVGGCECDALVEIGHAAESAVIAALDSRNVHRREGAARVLHDLEPYSPEALKVFDELITDENDLVRVWACVAFSGVSRAAWREAETRKAAKEEQIRQREAAKRLSKQQIETGLPPDANHNTPCTFKESKPIEGPNGEKYLAVIYQGMDWGITEGDDFGTIAVIWAEHPDGYGEVQRVDPFGQPGVYRDTCCLYTFRYAGNVFLVTGWLCGGTDYHYEYSLFALGAGHRIEEVELRLKPDSASDVLAADDTWTEDEEYVFADDNVVVTAEFGKQGDCRASTVSEHCVSWEMTLRGKPFSGKKAEFVVKDPKKYEVADL